MQMLIVKRGRLQVMITLAAKLNQCSSSGGEPAFQIPDSYAFLHFSRVLATVWYFS